MKLTEASLRVAAFTLPVKSSAAPELIDITEEVKIFIRRSEIQNGTVLVYSTHTTAAIVIQENEPLLLQDLGNFLERLSPRNAHYRHNDFDVRTVHMHENECANGHSHCQHFVLGTSETLPVIDGALPLGEFQRIFFVELDSEKTCQVDHREVLIQIMGI